jgi:hypothetical protein
MDTKKWLFILLIVVVTIIGAIVERVFKDKDFFK